MTAKCKKVVLQRVGAVYAGFCWNRFYAGAVS